MKTYLIIDTLNVFNRGYHAAVREPDPCTKVASAFHIALTSIANLVNKLNPDHVVFCCDSKSWREQFYPNYKYARKLKRAQQTPEEREGFNMLFSAIDNFMTFVDTKTNSTVLKAPGCEADDFIARWTQRHSTDLNIIVSTDSDFQQLISSNVLIYHPIQEYLLTLEGAYNLRGKKFNTKDGEHLTIGDPRYQLFMKCIRGDTSDSVLSAYPGVREKGTKTKIGIRQAYEDMDTKGYDWNTFMASEWKDQDGNTQLVKDRYQFNKVLIDLTQQPDHIIKVMDDVINSLKTKEIPSIGTSLLQFAGNYVLNSIMDKPMFYLTIFNRSLKMSNEGVHIDGKTKSPSD